MGFAGSPFIRREPGEPRGFVAPSRGEAAGREDTDALRPRPELGARPAQDVIVELSVARGPHARVAEEGRRRGPPARGGAPCRSRRWMRRSRPARRPGPRIRRGASSGTVPSPRGAGVEYEVAAPADAVDEGADQLARSLPVRVARVAAPVVVGGHAGFPGPAPAR